jgi:hypothetical protein
VSLGLLAVGGLLCNAEQLIVIGPGLVLHQLVILLQRLLEVLLLLQSF